MSHNRHLSLDSVCSALSIDSTELLNIMEHTSKLDIGVAKEWVKEHVLCKLPEERSYKDYKLKDILTNMLDFCPSEDGTRHVAACLICAKEKGDESECEEWLAQCGAAWIDNLFFPSAFCHDMFRRYLTDNRILQVRTRPVRNPAEPSPMQTPSGAVNELAVWLDKADRGDQPALRNLVSTELHD
jgi:hypothetical protein